MGLSLDRECLVSPRFDRHPVCQPGQQHRIRPRWDAYTCRSRSRGVARRATWRVHSSATRRCRSSGRSICLRSSFWWIKQASILAPQSTEAAASCRWFRVATVATRFESHRAMSTFMDRSEVFWFPSSAWEPGPGRSVFRMVCCKAELCGPHSQAELVNEGGRRERITRKAELGNEVSQIDGPQHRPCKRDVVSCIQLIAKR